jgi:hypothetical protein
MPRIVPNLAYPPQQGEASGSRTAPAHMTSSPSSSSMHGVAAVAAMNGRDRSGSLDSNLDMISPDGQRIAMARKGAPPMFRRNSDLHRSLVGSLTSSYPFVEKGLCKKVSLGTHPNAYSHCADNNSRKDYFSRSARQSPSSHILLLAGGRLLWQASHTLISSRTALSANLTHVSCSLQLSSTAEHRNRPRRRSILPRRGGRAWIYYSRTSVLSGSSGIDVFTTFQLASARK